MPDRRLVVNEIVRATRSVFGNGTGPEGRLLADEILTRFGMQGWEVLGYEDAAAFDETARFEVESQPENPEIGGNLGGNLGGNVIFLPQKV